MRLGDNLSILAALLLAAAAALTSGDAEARRQVAGFVTEALRPQAADTGDFGYLVEESSKPIWPLPPRRGEAAPDGDRD